MKIKWSISLVKEKAEWVASSKSQKCSSPSLNEWEETLGEIEAKLQLSNTKMSDK